MLRQLPALLLPWFAEHRRDLPWRRDRAPYHVWLSEIMLQQTRVEAVRGYYTRFLSQLPTIVALAAAPEDQILKLWEGLGYYSRVRNLQKAARQIMELHGGQFPSAFDAIRALPGIGDYTAGAIASICFEAPRAAVDGNVLRVWSRYMADDRPVTRDATKKEVAAVLSAYYPAGHCGDFTQALMELGATVCLPNGAPLCHCCPLAQLCRARVAGTQLAYPVKEKKKPRRVEERTVFVLTCGEKVALCRRPEKGLLAGLWQLPDVAGTLSLAEMLAQAEAWGVHPRTLHKTVQRSHIFTHVEWKLTGCYLECSEEATFTWVTPEERLDAFGLPTAYRQFLDE